MTVHAYLRCFAIGTLALAATHARAQSALPPTAPTSLYNTPVTMPAPSYGTPAARAAVSPSYGTQAARPSTSPSHINRTDSFPRNSPAPVEERTARTFGAPTPRITSSTTARKAAPQPAYTLPSQKYTSPAVRWEEEPITRTAKTTSRKPAKTAATATAYTGSYQPAGTRSHYSNPAVPKADTKTLPRAYTRPVRTAAPAPPPPPAIHAYTGSYQSAGTHDHYSNPAVPVPELGSITYAPPAVGRPARTAVAPLTPAQRTGVAHPPPDRDMVSVPSSAESSAAPAFAASRSTAARPVAQPIDRDIPQSYAPPRITARPY